MDPAVQKGKGIAMNEMVTQAKLGEQESVLFELERLAHQLPLRDEADYDQVVTLVNWLVDRISEDSAHPLRGAMSLMVEQVRQFDELHYRLPDPAPHELVEFMMEQRGVGFDQMASVADAETLAAVVAGRRPIDTAMAERLGDFFHLPAELFALAAPA